MKNYSHRRKLNRLRKELENNMEQNFRLRFRCSGNPWGQNIHTPEFHLILALKWRSISGFLTSRIFLIWISNIRRMFHSNIHTLENGIFICQIFGFLISILSLRVISFSKTEKWCCRSVTKTRQTLMLNTWMVCTTQNTNACSKTEFLFCGRLIMGFFLNTYLNNTESGIWNSLKIKEYLILNFLIENNRLTV